jgi:hypothetical protein
MHRQCKKCQEIKLDSEFYCVERHANRWYFSSCCKICDRQKSRDYGAKHREKKAEQARVWRINNPDKIKSYSRSQVLRKHNLTEAQYEQMFADQGCCCVTCGSKENGTRWYNFAIDHDHVTGVVRGLLCFSCNTTLGKVNDSIQILQNLIDYLKKHG